MSDTAGTDVAAIQENWGSEFRDLEIASDWSNLGEKVFEYESRWCLHWTQYVKHDSGLIIGIKFATDVGDGESSDYYPDEWFEAEAYEVTETRYRKKTT